MRDEKTWKEKNKSLSELWGLNIDQWKQSSISQVEYCRQHDLVRHRFTYWKTKLKKQNLPVEFIQIPDSSPINPVGLKLNIGLGLQIEVLDGFSRNTWKRC